MKGLKNENYNIVALIGDGSLSGGEALEGLNFASKLDSNFIIILNDNDMAINSSTLGIEGTAHVIVASVKRLLEE